jgi:beta-galactosidase/beta-glucuronidase
MVLRTFELLKRPDRRWWALAALAALALVLGLQILPERSAGADKEPGPYDPLTYKGPDDRTRLGGEWIVALDERNTGRDRGWQDGDFPGEQVTVPHVPEAAEVRGEESKETWQGNVAWYRTTIEVPTTGVYAVRFESVNHEADVWIDGEHEVSNTGTYLPFEARRTLTAGTHTLVVRADWRDPDQMKAEAWHRTWFNFGGINRDVTIRPVGDSELLDPTVVTTLDEEGDAVVDVSVKVRNRTGRTRELELDGGMELIDDGRDEELDFEPVRVPAGKTVSARARMRIDDPELWSTDDPRLWALRLEIGEEAGYRARVGLREIRRKGRDLLLNGEKVFLRGASIHEDVEGKGDALDRGDHDWIVGALKSIGANATRAQHQLHPALVEQLDEAGILLYLGIGVVDAPGAFTSKTPKLRRQSRQRVLTTVDQLQSHPSIITWNLANEVAGDGHPDGQAAFIDDMAVELKERDPSRPIALDIWGSHPPRKPSLMYRNIDIIGWTNYIGWYEGTYASRKETQRTIRDDLADLREAMPGKAIVVTEFGAEGNGLNPNMEPGGFGFQSRLLRTHLEVYGSDPKLNGALIWNLRDFAVNPTFAGGSISRQVPDIQLVRGVNQKGIFDHLGRPKPAIDDVRALFDGMAEARGEG